MNNAIARKELSRVFTGGKETVVNERIDFEIPPEVSEALNEVFDDPEDANNNGIYSSDDDSYSLISDVELMLEALQQKIDDKIDDDQEDNIEREQLLINFFKKYKGYQVWL